MKKIKEELKNYIEQVPIIDVHEHIIDDDLRISKFPDYIALAVVNYIRTAAVSAGLSEESIIFMQENNPLEEKYPLFCQALEHIQYTYTFKAMEIAFKEIYGVSLLNPDYQQVNAIFCAKNKPGITEQILQQYNIKAAINDVFFPTMQGTSYNMGNKILKNSARCDRYIMVQTYLKDVEQEFNTKLPTLEDFVACFKNYLKMQVTEYGALAIKIGVAYERSLKFNQADLATAETVYQQMYAALLAGQSLERKQIEVVEDYMAHQVLATAQEYDLTIQIHTGTFEGNDNVLENSHPLLLSNLFREYPKLRFDIFHIGYPFAREVGTLVRTFPNAYANFSWAYIVAPEFANDILEEYIGFLPANKFSVFGGDFVHIEGSIGQLIILRKYIAKRLAKMIKQNKLDLDQAKQIIRNIFYQNAAELYGLQDYLADEQ